MCASSEPKAYLGEQFVYSTPRAADSSEDAPERNDPGEEDDEDDEDDESV